MIKFIYDEVEYTLEFDLNSADATARKGLDITKMGGEQILSAPTMLFEGALAKHHGHISKSKKEEIFNSFKDKTDLITALVQMYSDTIEKVYTDGEGKTSWEVVEG